MIHAPIFSTHFHFYSDTQLTPSLFTQLHYIIFTHSQQFNPCLPTTLSNKAFAPFDRIFCHSGKYQSQYATVMSVGTRRFTVKFDDPDHIGKYVDYTDATILHKNYGNVDNNKTPNHKHYAVVRRRKQGIYIKWEDCER